MMAAPDRQVTNFIAARRPPADSPATRALTEVLRRRHGDSLQAILFYGSCLRRRKHHEGLLDLYLLVDDYRTAYQGRALPALANRWLPPNVYYLETRTENPAPPGTVRCKYAILSLEDFLRGCRDWFHPYLWGRFTQPTALLYCRAPRIREFLDQIQAEATMHFLEAVLPALPVEFTLADLWCRGFSLSYASELRPERPEQGTELFSANREYYEKLAGLALPVSRFSHRLSHNDSGGYRAMLPSGYRRRARRAWKLRALQGKILSLLRLSKAAFTFNGGLDYICWKIERHSGLELSPPAGSRHTPITFSRALWRAWRAGGFR